MGSTKTTTRTIRIANEAAEYFAKKPLNRAVESLYGLLRSGKLKFDGEEIKIECTHPKEEKMYTPDKNIPKTDYESIEEMADLMKVSAEKLLSDIRELLEDGTLYYSGGKLVNPRYEDFERACEGKNIDKILDGLIRSL